MAHRIVDRGITGVRRPGHEPPSVIAGDAEVQVGRSPFSGDGELFGKARHQRVPFAVRGMPTVIAERSDRRHRRRLGDGDPSACGAAASVLLVNESTIGADFRAPHVGLVVRLLREHAPHLADLPVRACPVSGSSNWVFRLGDWLAVRLPRSDDYAQDLAKAIRWLPRIADAVSVPVPRIEFVGAAGDLFPRLWAVMSWVPGSLPRHLGVRQEFSLADTLGQFMRSLHAVDAGDGACEAENWGYRAGEPVTDDIDRWVDEAADSLSDLFHPARVRHAWQLLRDVPPPTMPRSWIHTDLSAENLLVGSDGRLVGVIDFDGLGVGDRSVDLLYAWSLFGADGREVLRASSGVDEGTWIRARAWAFAGPGLRTIAHDR
jgi:aminoglycoside phosphotransferase (APT) family kinase protein